MPSKGKLFYGWVVMLASFIILFLVAGIRATSGVFIKPMTDAFGWSRASISLGWSLHALFQGLAQPVSGFMADRVGPKAVMVVGVVLLGLGFGAMGLVTDLWQVYVLYGVVAAVGFASSSMVPNSALIVRWFARRRGLAVASIQAGGAVGQLIIAPLAMAFILALGWQWAFGVLGVLLLGLALPVALFLIKNDPAQLGQGPDGVALAPAVSADDPPAASVEDPARRSAAVARPQPAREGISVGEAVRTSTFWLLTTALFICGYGANMLHTHLAPSGMEMGIGPMGAATALGIMGGAGLVGSLTLGTLSDQLGRKGPLAANYVLRGLGFLLLAQGGQEWVFYMGAAMVGVTVGPPIVLITALLADTFGSQSVGTLLGLLFLGHQVFGALGAYLAGVIYDATQSYYWAYLSIALVSLLATLIVLMVKEKRPLGAPSIVRL